MGPEHVPLSCLGEVVLTNDNFYVFRHRPRTRPSILRRAGCSYNCCVFEIWAPNTSRYPVSGRVFLRYGPRTRPAILSRGGYSCKRQVLCFFEMGPEHVPLSCVGQVDFYNCCVFEIWAPNTSRYPVSGRLFLQTSIPCFLSRWALNTSRHRVPGRLSLQLLCF